MCDKMPHDAPKQLEDWVQVQADVHYRPQTYLAPKRMASIGYQVVLIANRFQAGSLLEVGVGAGLSAQLLGRCGFRVSTLDVDASTHPHVLGSVTDIPCDDRQFDVVSCCQVLEHLPWSEAQRALAELHRVTRHGGLISVPTNRPSLYVRLHAFGRTGTRSLRLPALWRARNRLPSQHSWELHAGVSTRQFRAALRGAGFRIEREMQPVEHPYHHFFMVCRDG